MTKYLWMSFVAVVIGALRVKPFCDIILWTMFIIFQFSKNNMISSRIFQLQDAQNSIF